MSGPGGLAARLGGLGLAPSGAERMVPASGATAWLTTLTAAAMAFVAVFALALSLAAGRMADRWSEELARSATVRISAPPEQMEARVRAVMEVLTTTPGIASARLIDEAEQRGLLEPWFGPDLPVDALPLPRLVEVIETGARYDVEGLRLRLAAEAPGAVLDDHTRWRRPLVQAAGRLRALGLASVLLMAGAVAGMVTLAATASLAANARLIAVLRLVGARDVYIARGFVRRFTRRAGLGAVLGTGAGMAAIAFLPGGEAVTGAFLTGLAFEGREWLWPLLVPPFVALVAFGATRAAAMRMLRAIP